MVIFAIHWHELDMDVHVFPCPELPSHLPSLPIPLGYPSALALSALFHALNLDWSSVSNMVIYMLQCYSLKSSCTESETLFFISVSLLLCQIRVIITIFLNSVYMF